MMEDQYGCQLVHVQTEHHNGYSIMRHLSLYPFLTTHQRP